MSNNTINSLYAPNGNSIDERIKKFQTLFFEDKIEAEAYARKIKTYAYPVYGAYNNLKGYGVPK